jgi:hypothetical protein
VQLGITWAYNRSGLLYHFMNTIDVKKLVVAFLLVSTVTSSVLFGVSAYLNRPVTTLPETAAAVQNPFVEKLPVGSTDAEVTALLASQGKNVTAEVGSLLAQEIVNKNPDGPTAQDGQPAMVVPGNTDQLVTDYVAANPPTDASLQPHIDETKINVLKNATPEDETHYLSQVADITSAAFSTLQANTDNTNLAEWLTNSKTQLEGNVGDLLALQVPERLVPFHKSLLNTILVPSNYLTLTINDPLSAAALQQNFERILAEQSIQLQQTASDKTLSEGIPFIPENISLLNRILGVQVAHATLPTIDYVHIAYSVVHFYTVFKDIIEKAAIGYLKDTLLRTIEQQTLTWAAGGPKPQFVTNWDGFFKGSVDQGLGAVIDASLPALCGNANTIAGATGLGNISAFIRQVLSPVSQSGFGNGSYIPRCTLDKVIANINDFTHDFRNGGWLSYSALFEPQNTLIGSILELKDQQLFEGAKQVAAAAADAQGGGGFVGQKVCDNGQPPSDLPIKQLDLSGQVTKVVPAGGCADGSQPTIPTPGRLVGDLVSHNLGGTTDRITSATDWPALAGALVQAAMSRLYANAQKGLFGLIAGKGHSGSGSGSSGGGGAPAPIPADPDGTKEAQQILDQKKATLTYARDLATDLDQTMKTLKETILSCSDPSVVAVASTTLQSMATLANEASLKIATLIPVVDSLTRFVQAIPSPPPATLATTLHNQFGTYAQAQQEAATFEFTADGQDKRGVVQDAFINAQNIYGSSCLDNPVIPTPAPAITNVNPVSGPIAGGQSVIITGTDLSGATVTIGGNSATVTGTTATTATFTTPAHAEGAVDITVTTAGGSATSPGGYTYVAPTP